MFANPGSATNKGLSRRSICWRASYARDAICAGIRPVRCGSRLSLSRFVRTTALVFLAALLAIHELRTSALQSRILSHFAKQMSYSVQPGASTRIVFPKWGPFDSRLGYTRIPDYISRLKAEQFRILAQARFSRPLERIARWGIALPYREPTGVGLTIHSSDGSLIYTTVEADRQFRRFEDISPLLVKALLMMENRELANPSDSRANPVVEWDRLAKAGLSYAGTKLGLPVRLEGGSTLATQIDKYRHSMNGRTGSALDKLQQITGASLKVYRLGPDTRLPRHEIIQDYLNTVPLAAAPFFGEVHGIGEGLEAWFGMRLDKVMRDLNAPGRTPAKALAFKHVVGLLASVRAPSHYLLHDRDSLERRTNFYVQSLASSGAIDNDFAALVESTPLSFLPTATSGPKPLTADQKTANAIRNRLSALLGVPSYYELDRLHLRVQSSIDSNLQRSVLDTFRQLNEPEFLAAEGFDGERLLKHGDPDGVLYSFVLFEVVPEGNALVVQFDTLNQPFDLNTGMKLELGSTAKLRTLAHYLEVVASLHSQLGSRSHRTLPRLARDARDPITRWVRIGGTKARFREWVPHPTVLHCF